MAKADGSVIINTKLNTSNFNTGVKSMVSGLKSIAGAVGVAFSVAALVKFGKEAIELSSDLSEVDNVVNKAFGDMRDQMDALANESIETLGMSRLTAYQTGSTFMSMGKSMLSNSQDAATMALELTKLTGNMASFYNVEQDVASTALKSIYTGETETLKKYGVVMSEVNLTEYARAKGITKEYSAMSQSEKVMLRYKYVTEQLSFIGDDFIDTQDSWANQTRILSEQWKEFMTIVGNGLVTALTPALQFLNQMVAKLIDFANAISAVLTNVFGLKAQTMTLSESSDSASDAADSMEDYADATEDAAKAAQSGTAAFDELNVLTSSSSDSDSSSGSSVGSLGSLELDTDSAEESADTVASIFETTFQKIKEKFDEFRNNLDFTNLINSFQHLKDSVMAIVDKIGPSLEWLWDNVLAPFGEWSIEDAIPAFFDALASAFELITKVGESAWNNVLKPLWENFLQPALSWVGDKVVDFLHVLAKIFSDVAANQTAVDVLAGFAIAIGAIAAAIAIWNVAQAILNGLLAVSPITWIILAIVALVAAIVLCITYWDKIKVVIEKVWASIKKVVNDIYTTIKNVFTKVWDFMKKIINTILGGIETMVNGIIKGLNKMISAMNKLSFDVPDWVPELGGKTFGFNIPSISNISIPRLANGGVTTGSTLANIGEAGREAVLPLEQNTGWMDTLADKLAQRVEVTFNVEGDPNHIFKVVQKESRIYNKRTGVPAF